MIIVNRYQFQRWERRNALWHLVDWTEQHNIVPTEGLNEYQKEFWKGSAYTAAFFVGLIRTDNFGSVQLTDTAAQIVTGVPAGGNNQWREFTGYNEATRQAPTFGAIANGSLDNSSSPAVFTVNANFTLQGGFIVTSNVKGGTSGLLIGAASAPSQVPYLVGQQVRVVISSTLSN